MGAEHAVAEALAKGEKVFYTTPIKALSNQKFGDYVRIHGAEKIGLLTGDNAINGDAPVVVMTTEVLRNMIYAASPSLRGLRYVVLDEVHYLQDQYRGPVWEEVIIHTPMEVDLVCLSATVSNAEEFADWIQTVRGATVAIIEEHRPVVLNHLYLVGDRESDELRLLPTFVDGRPNPEAARLDAKVAHSAASFRNRPRSSGLQTPRRADVVERLWDERMLPAIYFIFSRAGCDEAVRQSLHAGLRLTTPEERTAIRAIAESRTQALSDDDLAVLGYGPWLTGLESGLAAHHAGMVPAFKEAVEEAFNAGLVKAVFATETLALGINMPARSVVIEKLSKFTGERHEFLSPGQYTQLTGRAGRRGIDEVGYAVVLWSPFVPFDQVAGLASTRTYALTSSFHPTYNMAANLVRRYSPEQARHLLNLSFAQYRADRDVVRLETQLERTAQHLEEARRDAECDLGDVEEYRALVRAAEAARVEAGGVGGAGGPKRQRPDLRQGVVDALELVRPGDVLVLSGGKSPGRVAVLSTARRRGSEVRLGAITVDRRYLTLSARDFSKPPQTVAHIDLPTPYAPRNAAFQREVAQALVKAKARTVDAQPSRAPVSVAGSAEMHPAASCPDLRRHLRAAERADRLEKDLNRLHRRIEGRTESLARQFDRVLRVMEVWGYVDGWSLTPAGEQLTRIYHECDLLVASALEAGLFDDLDPAAVASLASAFTFEARRGPARGGGGAGDPEVWFPSGKVQKRWAHLERLADELNATERDAGLPLTRSPDPGFFAVAHGWAAGEDLADVMADEAVTGGDFVRNMKQLIDLLRQLAIVTAATSPATSAVAEQAADRLLRGVVAASSVAA
ncbi:MAG: ATP-dependent helicase HelY [Actinomycetota bacterium]|nr:ATP-dependent helicase HelY [Actinomycetota bacterium]